MWVNVAKGIVMPPDEDPLPPKLQYDTALPDLAVDFERQEVSFEWVPMFNSFFAEAAEHARRNALSDIKLTQRFKQGLETWNDDVHAREVPLKKLNDMKTLEEWLRFGSQCNQEQIRRERIRAYYRKAFDFRHPSSMFGEQGEEDALKKLDCSSAVYSHGRQQPYDYPGHRSGWWELMHFMGPRDDWGEDEMMQAIRERNEMMAKANDWF